MASKLENQYSFAITAITKYILAHGSIDLEAFDAILAEVSKAND